MNIIRYMLLTDRRLLLAAAVVLAVAAGVFTVMPSGGDEAQKAEAEKPYHGKAGGNTNAAGHSAAQYYDAPERAVTLQYFDPNTADSTLLLSLGLEPWQVRSIYRYRAKGGIYRTKADFARLYGLTAAHFRRLEPYIRISADYRPAAESLPPAAHNTAYRDTIRHPLKLNPGQTVALNTADTLQLQRVPGIGRAFAAAIVRRREQLGGFSSTEQLGEIEGLPHSALPYFTLGTAPLRTISLNDATLSELRRHPYISFYQAKTIIEHRRRHGRIKSIDDLHLYADFPEAAINRLRPYVTP